ncbi:hypothetical protein ABNQ39_13055 [Azospirillum sp. A26]|uniref:hypothetical protein n=1 Tax=Azospirillum sp. A26 TaxID=3160607 RepID=UPI0036712259
MKMTNLGALMSSTCWICGNIATTGEHMNKRSDLRSVFGHVSQNNPLYKHDANEVNQVIKGLNVVALKSPGRLCANCNNARTQSHDRAWEKLSLALREHDRHIQPGKFIRTTKIFRYDTKREMLNVHLYFTKLFGCHIAGNDVPISLGEFSEAIKNGVAHPKIFLRFGCGAMFTSQPVTGMSDMWLALTSHDNQVRFATWLYHVGDISVNVMFAVPGERRQGLIDAWHPSHGTTRLKVANFLEDTPEK